MGLSRWLEAAGIDPKMFRRVAAARYGRGRNFGASNARSENDAPAEREDSPSATLKPGVTGERSESKGPDRRGDTDPVGDGNADCVHDASRGDMPPAMGGVPMREPGSSIPNERSRHVTDPGSRMDMLNREHQACSG